MVAGVRPSGLDIMDLSNTGGDGFIISSLNYNFKNAVFCGERKTSTIP